MRDELHRHLDGDLPGDELPVELRGDAAAWEAFLEEARAAGPAGAPSGLAGDVMRAVVAGEGEPGWRRALAWWVRPRSVRISPLGVGLAAAAVLALALALPFAGPDAGPDVPAGTERAAGGPPPPAATPAATQTVYVKFLLEAPAARSVSLAGNFSDWSPSIPLHDPDGDGVWSATVPMRPGVHEYMFVVDGSTWVTDPYAERYEEDGYGHRNAVLAIAGPTAGT